MTPTVRVSLLALLNAVGLCCGGRAPEATVAVVPSPNGSVEAVLTESDGGGATTSFTYTVYLVEPGSEWSGRGSKVASLYAAIRNEHAYGVNLRWSGESLLTVECLRAGYSKVIDRVVKVGGHEVTTTVKTGVLDPSAPTGSMERNAAAGRR